MTEGKRDKKLQRKKMKEYSQTQSDGESKKGRDKKEKGRQTG